MFFVKRSSIQVPVTEAGIRLIPHLPVLLKDEMLFVALLEEVVRNTVNLAPSKPLTEG